MIEPRDPTRNGARGREAERPAEIPRRGWRDILVRTWKELGHDKATVVAAGVAFFATMSMIPAISATLAIWGLFADPESVRALLTDFVRVMPPDAASVVTAQLARLASQPADTLSVTAVVSILITLWSATAGMKMLITVVNIAYEQKDRSIIRHQLVGVAFTLAAIIGVIVTLAIIVAVPPLASYIGLEDEAYRAITALRWLLLAAFVVAGLTLLYRWAPARRPPKLRWANWGAVIATLLWLVGSLVLSQYVSRIGDFHTAYGSLGAVFVLMLWFYVSSLAIIVGAEINAEMEHQTRRDTTVDPEKPMGKRGAYVADHVGPVP